MLYEVHGGGEGARHDRDGVSATRVHLANTSNTPAEVIEANYKIRVEQQTIRRSSGGAGKYRGGDGVVRRMRFLEPMRASILSNRRAVPPRGLNGGGDGAAGINRVERANGDVETLPATAGADMAQGDVFVIETPGGGGYGRA